MRFELLDFGTTQRAANKQRASGERALNFMPVMEAIAVDMLAIEETVFTSQGRRGGGRWKALAPDTVRRKGGDQRILFTSGHENYGSGDDALFRSVTKPDAPDQILKVFKTTIHFGTKRKYAARLQYGGKGIPARPFIRFLPTDVARWERWFLRHVMEPFV
jgi:phage gpG-like protein